MYIPDVVEIIHRVSDKKGDLFTVKWKDGTSTTVKRREGEVNDEYTAFLYAMGKKLFENKGTARKYVDKKKAVFEDRVEQRSRELKIRRQEQSLQQSLDAEEAFKETVYDDTFVSTASMKRLVAPSLIEEGLCPIGVIVPKLPYKS